MWMFANALFNLQFMILELCFNICTQQTCGWLGEIHTPLYLVMMPSNSANSVSIWGTRTTAAVRLP